MKKMFTSLFLLFICWSYTSVMQAQNPTTISNAEVKPLNLIKITQPVRDINTAHDGNVVRYPKIGYHPKKDWPLHEITNKDALPNGIDPAWQLNYAPRNTQKILLNQWEGQGPGNSTFSPGDPALDVGPNHVVQMVNGIGGSNVEIWDKAGNSLTSFIFDGVTGIPGAGDPIVIYDQLADRWLLSEFGPQGANVLIIGISMTPDPTGAYAIYSFGTPSFPDYPKYSIWNDSYIVTTNETNSRIYALDRVKMLAGDPTATAQQFDIMNFQTIGFQAATPVNLDGTTLPPTGAPGMFMRMADDGWSGVNQDRLEIFEMNIDFNNAANSSITGPFNLPTQPFDTELNGFTAFSAIAQPGTNLELDPLREVLMNKIIYRNFGSYEALVCNHVTDVTGNDDAGVRWYELRRTGGTSGAWTIFQQGTYSPDNTSRWMAAIGLNDDGSIGLAYNVSDATSVFPGIRYTGRKECDPLGVMTWPETTIIEGSTASNSNRYGDYSTLTVDPVDGTFWVTAQYSPTPAWATRVAHFEIPFDCFGINLLASVTDQIICQPDDAVFDFEMEFLGGFTGNVNFSVTGLPAGATATFSANPANSAGMYNMTVSNTGAATPGTYPLTITATDGTESDMLIVNLTIDGAITTAPTLLTPANNATGVTTSPNYTWNPVAGASSYVIEIATDAAFTNIIETATVTGTSHAGMILNTTTQYFWRVSAENSCGQGPFSQTFNFQTGSISCTTVSSTDTPIIISPNGTPTITSIITIPPNAGTVTDVNITKLTIDHTWVGDLTITLTDPSGNTATLFSGICGNVDDVSIVFDDGGAPNVSIPCPPTDGNAYQPLNLFNVFNGGPASGIWTLTIADGANVDGGELTCWDLEVCSITAGTCPGTLAASITASSDVSCNGGTDGTATVTATGGVLPYTYAWSNGATTATVTGLAAGTYSVVVTDADGCMVTDDVTIAEPAAISASITASSNVNCNGGSDGSATVTASGGTAPYSYAWSNGATTAINSGLAAGAYSVIVTDANGCMVSANVTLTEPTAISSSITSSNVSCNGGSDGSATVTANGGTAPYTYAWSNGATTATNSGLAAGAYSIIVTDANGCTANDNVSITEPPAISLSTSSSPASCGGNTDGSASVTASGGTPGYTYVWSSGGTLATENNLAAGSYTVTVTDSNGCTEIGSVTVTAGGLTWIPGSPSATDATCSTASDGTASAIATNGTPPYTYAWSNGATGSTITGLIPSTYSVVATDATGCTLNGSVTVGAGASISVSATGIDESCLAIGDGSATATATGGSGNYTYSWSNGGTTATITGLTAGTYTVLATDVNTGCFESTSVTISSGTGISVTVSGTNESCIGNADGSATATVSGGSGNYSYNWSSGGSSATETGLSPGSYTVTVTDQTTGCDAIETVSISSGTSFTINTSSTPADCGSTNGTATATASGPGTYTYAWSNGGVGSTITGLAGGTYTVSVTESPSGCMLTATTTVGVSGGISFTPGFPIGRDESCLGENDGAVGATATGGIAPYTYNWEDAAGNALTTISGLAPGTYFVTATDASGCTVSGSATVNPGIVLNWVMGPGAINTTCAGINDGEVFATAGGGTAPYTNVWVDSNGSTIGGSGGIGNGSSTGLDNLGPGTYCVTATDANGCTISDCVTVMDGPGLSWNLSPTATGETCFGNSNGTVNAVPTGGTAPISIVWTNSAGNQVGTTGLAPGVYTVVATDANGCTVSGSATVAAGVNEYTMANGNMLVGTQAVTQDFEVDGAIESNQLVTGGSGVNVDYDSGTMITLKPDFEVTQSTVFHAFIDGCGGAMLRETTTEKR